MPSLLNSGANTGGRASVVPTQRQANGLAF